MLKLPAEQRRALILRTGAMLANEIGLERVTPGQIAKRCEFETSRWTVKHYFKTQSELWLAIAKHRDASSEVVSTAKKFGLLG